MTQYQLMSAPNGKRFRVPGGYRKIGDFLAVCHINLRSLEAMTATATSPWNLELRKRYRRTITNLEAAGVKETR